MSMKLLEKEKATELLGEYVQSENLREHCKMVALAMQKSAQSLGKSDDEQLLWWATGLLHDLDWEMYPDEHPNYAAKTIFPSLGYPSELIDAILSHAPERTGKEPATELERYLFACDEISGFLKAVSLMRPTGFEGMTPKSVIKKMKDKRFAANVSREDIRKGAELIERDLPEHISFLITVFNENDI